MNVILLTSILVILGAILFIDRAFIVSRLKKLFKKTTSREIFLSKKSENLFQTSISKFNMGLDSDEETTSNQDIISDEEDDGYEDEFIEERINTFLSPEDHQIVIRAGIVLLRNKFEYLQD